MLVRVPLMVGGLVMTALTGFDGVIFSGLEHCPVCGGAVRIHDFRDKKVANCIEDRGIRTIRVRVGRYYCIVCKSFVHADEPFYPGTRHGSPVVDLALTLSGYYPHYRTSRIMEQMGISIDRGTVRNYTLMKQRVVPAIPLYGMPLPLSVITLSELFTRSGEGHPVTGTEVLRACGFPSARGTGPHRFPGTQEGDQRDEQEECEKRDSQKKEDT